MPSCREATGEHVPYIDLTRLFGSAIHHRPYGPLSPLWPVIALTACPQAAAARRCCLCTCSQAIRRATWPNRPAGLTPLAFSIMPIARST